MDLRISHHGGLRRTCNIIIMKNKVFRQFTIIIVCLVSFGLFSMAANFSERAYLQTDKNLYLSGELIWTKILVTDVNGCLSRVSKVGYVELLDGTTAVAQARLSLDGGVGDGYLQLPATLPSGNYRLVGYTRYMRNEGEKIFFEKNLSVVNTFITPDNPISDNDKQRYKPVERASVITVSTDKSSYSCRSNGMVKINGLPADIATMSLSIAGVDLFQECNTRDIIEVFGSLSSTVSEEETNGEKFIPEYEGPIVTGKLVDLSTGERSGNEAVRPLLAVPGKDIRLFGGKVEKNGDVIFFTKHIAGAHEVASVAISPTSARYRVDLESPFATHSDKRLPMLSLNPSWGDELLKRSVGLQVLHSYMADSILRVLDDKPWFRWESDWRYNLDEYTRFSTMEEVVLEFVRGLRFRKIDGMRRLSVLTEERLGFTVGNTLALLDGIPIIDHEQLFKYDPLKIKRIDVYRGKYMFGGQMFDGIASFLTYNNDYPGLELDETTQLFDYHGTQKRTLFYAPSYSLDEERNSVVPDYRHTLLWAPRLTLDGDDEISIPFTTSDLTGDYLITVEGVTKDGKPLKATPSNNCQVIIRSGELIIFCCCFFIA